MRTLEDELSEMPVRQSGGAAYLKEREVILIARRGDKVIKRLRSKVEKLRDEVKRLRRRKVRT